MGRLVATSGAMELVVLALLLATSAHAMELVVELLVAVQWWQCSEQYPKPPCCWQNSLKDIQIVLGSLQTEKLTPETTKLKNFTILPNLTPKLSEQSFVKL